MPHPVDLPGVPPDRLDKVEDGVVCLGDAVVGPRRVVVLLDHALAGRETLLLL